MSLTGSDYLGNGVFADVRLKFTDSVMSIYINDRLIKDIAYYADKDAYKEDEQVVKTDGFYCRDGIITTLSYSTGYRHASILRGTLVREDGTTEEVVFSTGSEEQIIENGGKKTS